MFAKPKWLLLACVVASLILTSSAGVSRLQLYDNFSSAHIDTSKRVGEPGSIVGETDSDRCEVRLNGPE